MPPLSSTTGWVEIMLNIVIVAVLIVAFGAYPFVKWYAKRQKIGSKEDK